MDDRTAKRSGFGIGGLGAVPSSDWEAELEAERLQPTPRLRGRVLTCRRCRQQGCVGEHPFSTDPSSGLCDDCF